MTITLNLDRADLAEVLYLAHLTATKERPFSSKTIWFESLTEEEKETWRVTAARLVHLYGGSGT